MPDSGSGERGEVGEDEESAWKGGEWREERDVRESLS